MYKHILIPTDGSVDSEKACLEGIKLAKTLSADVTFLYVVEDHLPTMMFTVTAYKPELYEHIKQAGKELLKHAKSLADSEGVKATTSLIEKASPVDAILEAANETDLIVIGTHGHRGFNQVTFGSVAEGVIKRTHTPCLIIRAEEK